MILSEDQIRSIIKDNPAKVIVKAGQDYSDKMRMHIYGEKMAENTSAITGFENEDLMKVRAKYSRSNKDLFARLGRPIDKVFSAKGGSIYYNLPEAAEKQARSLSSNVRGYSVRKWIEMFWRAHMLDDPFGLVFLEILPKTEAVLAKQQGKSFIYPTYKSISSIYDYQTTGSSLEYVVFNLSKADKKSYGLDPDDIIFRVVDDANDYMVKKVDNDNILILYAFTIPNYFGVVPAMTNSDLVNADKENCFISFYDDAIELAEHFFLKGSIKITHEFLHAYPKYWQYATVCGECNGTKFKDALPCKSCAGTGKGTLQKVSDAMLLDFPSSKDEPIVTPNVAGYVTPDRAYYEIATTDLHLLEDAMNVTIWGSQARTKTLGMSMDGKSQVTKTATEIVDEVKPQADRLNVISEMAEKRHKFIIDNLIRLQVSQGYQDSSINYGRRYMIEGPDIIWEKYMDARTKGAAMSALDDLLIEYYEAKFTSDPVKLAIQVKLMKVEPFVHLTIQQTDLSGSITPENKIMKAYFGEWLSEQTDAILLSGNVKVLRDSLKNYSSTAVQAIADQKAAELAATNAPKQIAA